MSSGNSMLAKSSTGVPSSVVAFLDFSRFSFSR